MQEMIRCHIRETAYSSGAVRSVLCLKSCRKKGSIPGVLLGLVRTLAAIALTAAAPI